MVKEAIACAHEYLDAGTVDEAQVPAVNDQVSTRHVDRDEKIFLEFRCGGEVDLSPHVETRATEFPFGELTEEADDPGRSLSPTRPDPKQASLPQEMQRTGVSGSIGCSTYMQPPSRSSGRCTELSTERPSPNRSDMMPQG